MGVKLSPTQQGVLTCLADKTWPSGWTYGGEGRTKKALEALTKKGLCDATENANRWQWHVSKLRYTINDAGRDALKSITEGNKA